MRNLSPRRLLRVQVAVFLAGMVIGVVVALVTLSGLQDDSRSASESSRSALLVSEADARLGAYINQLQQHGVNFLFSPEVQTLSPDQQATVRTELFREDLKQDGPAELASLHLSLPLDEAVALASSLSDFQARALTLLSDVDGNEPATDEAKAALSQADEAARRYFADPNLANFRIFRNQLSGLRQLADQYIPALTADADAHQSSLERSIGRSRIEMLVGASLGGLVMAGFALAVGRRLERLFREIKAEQEALEATTVRLSQRNEQLSALYNVFAEITDTLSLRYVVAATLREALKLVHADIVVLRLLKDGVLIPAGSYTRDGGQIDDLVPIALGEDAVGRVAKRGRSLRFDSADEELLNRRQLERGLESGLIVPLIVGARVVGTLNCWSHQRSAFNEEDQRIIELMASQVATAVVAADTTDTSERRAHQDPLTGLPNRLQLNEDIAGDLGLLAGEGRRAVIAMADIDHFKRFNDDFGHRVGDVTLQRVASILRASVRESDRVYRYGGEEFVIIFPDASADEALVLAERVRANVEASPFSGEELQPVGPITISLGLAVMPDHGTDLVSLVDRADAAMYQAKEAGRNRIMLWGPRGEPAVAA